MRIALITAAALSFAAATPALADGGITVPLPDVSGVGAAEAPTLLRQIIESNVVGSNCPAYALTDGQWTLLTGTEDLLTAKLGLDPAAVDDQYYHPAFALLDDPTTCDRIGPSIRGVLKKLVLMGGGMEPVAP